MELEPVWAAGNNLEIRFAPPQKDLIFKMWLFVFPELPKKLREFLLSQKSSRWEEVWERRGDFIFFFKIEISLQPEAVLKKNNNEKKNQTAQKK